MPIKFRIIFRTLYVQQKNPRNLVIYYFCPKWPCSTCEPKILGIQSKYIEIEKILKTIFLRMIDKVRWISHFIIKWSLSSTSSWHIVFTWNTHIFIWRRALAVTLLVQSEYTIVLVDALVTGGRICKVEKGWSYEPNLWSEQQAHLWASISLISFVSQ